MLFGQQRDRGVILLYAQRITMARLGMYLLVLLGAALCHAQDLYTVEDDTTIDPTPTPSTPPTTPPSPADPSEPAEPGYWVIREGKKACVIANMGVRLNFEYPKTDGEMAEIAYDIPHELNDTTTDGSGCHVDIVPQQEDVLAINFFGGWTLEMIFKVDDDADNWRANDVSVTFLIDETMFPEVDPYYIGQHTTSINNVTVFNTPFNDIAYCKNEQVEDRFPSLGNVTVSVSTFSMKLQAFNQDPESDPEGDAVPCAADLDTDMTVPITLGSVWVGVVGATLIFYFIRRTAAAKLG